MSMLKIAITDDHLLFRKSLRLLIDSFENMQVVAEASNGKELIEKLNAVSVDIILLDLQMPEMNGFETLKEIRLLYPGIKTLVLTHLNEIDAIKKIVTSGAHGYFTKNTPPKELEVAIWKLEDNGFYFEKELASVIHDVLTDPGLQLPESKQPEFTERELEIILLIAQGLRAKEIAETLFISTKTVNAHKQNIQQKYNFDNMMSAILYCVHRKIIDIETLTFNK